MVLAVLGRVPGRDLGDVGLRLLLAGLAAAAALLTVPTGSPAPSRGDREQVLEERVDELSRTRRGALDSQAVELRRIERDLHDGAQARLVALSMKLGRRARSASAGRRTARRSRPCCARSREDASAAIRELRELARGIAPPVLTDRGLEAAVRSLADRSGRRGQGQRLAGAGARPRRWSWPPTSSSPSR